MIFVFYSIPDSLKIKCECLNFLCSFPIYLLIIWRNCGDISYCNLLCKLSSFLMLLYLIVKDSPLFIDALQEYPPSVESHVILLLLKLDPWEILLLKKRLDSLFFSKTGSVIVSMGSMLSLVWLFWSRVLFLRYIGFTVICGN